MEVVASNLSALTEQYRSVSQNLANSNTIGYKKQISQFQHTLNNISNQGNSPQATTMGRSLSNKIAMDFTQGSLEATDRKLDVALDGPGFFQVDTSNGPVYTRNGTFHLNQNGQLVNTIGQTIAGESGPITIPGDVSIADLSIGKDGAITAGGNMVGKLKVVEFEDNTILKPVGASAFQAPETLDPKTATETTVNQGYQEKSNVSPVEELVGLIRVSRLYEAGVKSISSHDDRLEKLMQVVMR